jgi:hypothetical protein
MGMKKEVLSKMTDDDLEVILDGIRAILMSEEKTSL